MLNCLISNSHDPYFNLAMEEYLLRSREEDFFLLYRNRPSVIVGKHQNLFGEVDYSFIRNQDIKPARRLSGGGTVFHDMENLNFSIIRIGERGKLVDFEKTTAPVREALGLLGVETEFGGHNSINAGGRKISGNAEHVFKQRLLHHGTLLFNTNLDMLEQVINNAGHQYRDKAVKSVRANVVNISDLMDGDMNIEQFESSFMDAFRQVAGNCADLELSPQDIESIERLRDEKYSTSDWIFSYSPAYSLNKTLTTPHGSLEVKLEVKKGRIVQIWIGGNLLDAGQISGLEEQLAGRFHNPDEIDAGLIELNLNPAISSVFF